MDRNCFVGIDMAKDSFQVHVLSTNEHLQCTTQPKDVQRFVRRLRALKPVLIVMEATGGYEVPLAARLQAAGLPTAVVNPRQIRDFAKAQGLLAKTDKIDAKVIAQFAEKIQPSPRSVGSEEERRVKALVARRRQLIRMQTAEKNRLQQAQNEIVLQSIQDIVDTIARQIDDLDNQIRQALEDNPEWRETITIIESTKGLAEKTSQALATQVPELGRLNRRKIASLVGVAPVCDDSGKRQGHRMIKGGRTHVRNALYMPTIVAIRWNPVIREFYLRLIARGKPPKVAIVACMRKLLTIINAMVRKRELWNPQSA